jgi:hypothetical protein
MPENVLLRGFENGVLRRMYEYGRNRVIKRREEGTT